MPNKSDTTGNLKPFKSGSEWNGNRKGRPKGSMDLNATLRKWLSVKETVTPDKLPLITKSMKLTQLDIICLTLIKKCRVQEDTHAISVLFDRLAGKPQRAIEIDDDSPTGRSVTITIE